MGTLPPFSINLPELPVRLTPGYPLSDGDLLRFCERNESLRIEQQGTFAPICPEFVIERRSPTDRLPDLQAKMQRWLGNGTELAWLVDPDARTVEIYRPGVAQPERLTGVTSVFGEGPVGGFVLETASLWQD